MDVSDIKTYVADVSLLNDAVAKWLKHSTDTVAKWITTNRVRMNRATTSHGNSTRNCECKCGWGSPNKDCPYS